MAEFLKHPVSRRRLETRSSDVLETGTLVAQFALHPDEVLPFRNLVRKVVAHHDAALSRELKENGFGRYASSATLYDAGIEIAHPDGPYELLKLHARKGTSRTPPEVGRLVQAHFRSACRSLRELVAAHNLR